MKVMISAILVFLASAAAQAALGRSDASVEQDSAQISPRATHQVRVLHDGVRVHEIQHGSSLVREFVSAKGQVFAVTWAGRASPNLADLLDKYWSEYDQAARANPGRRGKAYISIQTANLIVERGGHMGALRGRAYLPGLLPKGISLNDLR